ncbi:flagellar basal body-associated protein FliL [Variovorax sp. SRS16]|uniref:flagellar basal body-associated FliL family protein n=1 Tax=Variovorax sp. SRS16 TaxID=282217 RepID=UPI0013183FDC|nr:flagellar basal body-associated FliL family protein [Variovorax sp. SRS16]VTU25411.1 flagellar basal body-associated protein FliL [Variovorax sp. SRS16]
MATSPPVALEAPPARSPKLLILALVITIGLLAAATAGYVVVLPKLKTAEVAAPVPEKPIFIALEPLTVNLQGEGRPRFLHIGVALKVHGEKAKAQIMEFMPELRSRLLMLLANRTPDSLVSPEDKTRLADEIRAELDRPLGDDLKPQGIAGVSFNTFVVQ